MGRFRSLPDAIQTPYDHCMGQSLYFKVREEPSLIGHMDLEDSGEEKTFNKEGVKSFTKMINYCKEKGIDSKTDMSNKHHLNYKGAEKMTRWLGDYITEHYDIDTTDATDSTKAQMKENVEYYDEVVAKYAK